MNRISTIILAIICTLGILCGSTAMAAQRDTNTTTTVTAYTPKAPGDVLIGGTVAAGDSVWLAKLAGDTNAWAQVIGPTNTFNALAISAAAGGTVTQQTVAATLRINVGGTNYNLKLFNVTGP